MKKDNYNSSNQTLNDDLHILGKDDYITLYGNNKDKTKRKFRLFGNR